MGGGNLSFDFQKGVLWILAAAKIRKVEKNFAKKVEKEENCHFCEKSGHCTEIRRLGNR